MKTLVAYYSRTGTTKKAAAEISRILGCETDEVIDAKNRHGFFGYFGACMDSLFKGPAKIENAGKSPSKYGIVIIGTPIWAGTVSAPVRAYIHENKGKFRNVAFFCTMGGSGGKGAFREMGKLCGKKPVCTLELRASEVAGNKCSGKIGEFVKLIK